MKNYNLLAVILLNAVVISCNGPKKNNFSFDDSKFSTKFTAKDNVSLLIRNPDKTEIDSIVYYANDKKIGSSKDFKAVSFSLKQQKFGYQNLKAVVFAGGDKTGTAIDSRLEMVPSIQPKQAKYTLLNTFNHDISSFTEGLEFFRDTLFEGTGQYGSSKLLKTDYKTGKIIKSLNLDGKYFGEGITVINNKIYELTWKEKTGFIYNADTWKVEKTFAFDKDIEGWGMTNDGKYIYQSDGTEKIWKMDPETQKMLDYVNVYSGDAKIKQINELEYVDGKIYANIWQKDAIAIVDPANGAVEGILDLSALRKSLKAPDAEVLNGIAYNRKTKTFFVTGKNWDKMFEIKITE